MQYREMRGKNCVGSGQVIGLHRCWVLHKVTEIILRHILQVKISEIFCVFSFCIMTNWLACQLFSVSLVCYLYSVLYCRVYASVLSIMLPK